MLPGRLGDLVDTLLIYEKDVNPSTSPTSGHQAKPRSLEDVYQKIVDIIKEEDGSPLLLTNVKQKLLRVYDNFNEEDYDFVKFKDLIKAGAKERHFILNTAGLRDWLTLPQTDQLSTTNGTELPDEIDEVYEDVIEIIHSSNHDQALLSYVKHCLSKKYGGFDESVYGYNQFKELMQDGAKQGHFAIGLNDKQIYYATLLKREKRSGKNGAARKR